MPGGGDAQIRTAATPLSPTLQVLAAVSKGMPSR
jgi:hypothetical protein